MADERPWKLAPASFRTGRIFCAGIIQVAELRSSIIAVMVDTMTHHNTPDQFDAMWVPDDPETGREAPWEIDALWTPDINTEDQAAWTITLGRIEIKTSEIKSPSSHGPADSPSGSIRDSGSLSYLAESILEAQWILCTPLEAIKYALDEHIDAMIETGHSLYRNELDNPVGHAEFVAALLEIVQFFVANEAK